MVWVFHPQVNTVHLHRQASCLAVGACTYLTSSVKQTLRLRYARGYRGSFLSMCRRPTFLRSVPFSRLPHPVTSLKPTLMHIELRQHHLEIGAFPSSTTSALDIHISVAIDSHVPLHSLAGQSSQAPMSRCYTPRTGVFDLWSTSSLDES